MPKKAMSMPKRKQVVRAKLSKNLQGLAVQFGLLLAWIALLLIPSEGVAVIRVVGTLPDFAQLAEELGGERVEAQSLVLGTEDASLTFAPTHFSKIRFQGDVLSSENLAGLSYGGFIQIEVAAGAHTAHGF